MILSGEKKEEYREFKDYWTTRLDGKRFDIISFRNGYQKYAPKMIVEYNGLNKIPKELHFNIRCVFKNPHY